MCFLFSHVFQKFLVFASNQAIQHKNLPPMHTSICSWCRFSNHNFQAYMTISLKIYDLGDRTWCRRYRGSIISCVGTSPQESVLSVQRVGVGPFGGNITTWNVFLVGFLFLYNLSCLLNNQIINCVSCSSD